MATKLIIAIDYGTTYTSVAYALQTPEKQIIPIEINRDWPPSGAEYIPSQIAYRNQIEGESSTAQVAWGRHIEYLYDKPTWKVVNFAKARIHDCQENQQLLQIRKWPDESNDKGHYGPIKDMLRCIYEYVIGAKDSALKKVIPRYLADDQLEIKFICGVPSAWTVPEQLVFIDLMSQAGMPNAMRVPEPEAMATWYFHQYESFEAGNILVVMDAGGGTADMISYKVESVESLRLAELASHEGDCCGSTFLNLRFESLMKQKLKGKAGNQGDSLLHKLVCRFENAFKCTFSGVEQFVYRTGLREDSEPITISSEELCRNVFDPVIGRIIELLSKQIELTKANLRADWKLERKTRNPIAPLVLKIDQILMGGGLSANPYLIDKVRAEFWYMDVQKMPDNRTDVAKGLACIGCGHSAIKQRRSTLNYGVITQYAWDESLPSLDSLLGHVEEHTGNPVYPVVEWLVLKEHPVNDPSKFKRYRTESWGENDDWTTIHEIVVTEDRLDLDVGFTNWVDIEEHEIFEKQCDLSQVNKSRFEQRLDDAGEKYWEVEVSVEFWIRQGELLWKMKTPVSTPEAYVRTFTTERNPNPALGSLLSRGLEVPETYTQSLLENEKAERKNRQKAEREKRKTKAARTNLLVQRGTQSSSLNNVRGGKTATGRSGRISKR